MRQTRQRRLVWEAIGKLGSHRSAEEIAAHLQQSEAGLPRSTIYRVLDALTESGVLRAVNFGAGPTLYELVTEDHQHAICQSCGGVLHLDHSLAAGLEQHLLEQYRFRSKRIEVVVRGLCEKCVEAADATSNKERI